MLEGDFYCDAIDLNNKIDSDNKNFKTSYKKKLQPTLNYSSKCPHRYKIAIINNLLNKTHLKYFICTLFLNELKNKTNILINTFANNIINKLNEP